MHVLLYAYMTVLYDSLHLYSPKCKDGTCCHKRDSILCLQQDHQMHIQQCIGTLNNWCESKWNRSAYISSKIVISFCILQAKHFSSLNAGVSRKICPAVKKGKRSQIIPSSQWHPELVITQKLCDYLKQSKNTMVKGTCNWAIGNRFHG